ncbi:glycosyl transferase [Bacteroidia bacterium]|nr:glycosyl transferase [Bacteroidia bacterium]
MDISIIIVNYNTKELIRNCICSVFEKTQGVDFEVIVVDNASQDGSQEMLKKEFPNIKLIENNENLGFGRANNLGARYAKGKYLFLLNSDTILLSNAVKILFDFMESSPKCGICGGNLYDESGKPTMSYSMFLPSFTDELNIFFLEMIGKMMYGKNTLHNHSDKKRIVGFISGADFMIRAEIFGRMNGFDEDFFMYYEETELTFRVRKAGWLSYSIPQAKITHLESKSTKNWQTSTKIFFESRDKYYRKTHNKLYHKICNALLWINLSYRYIAYKIIGNTNKCDYYKYIIKVQKKLQQKVAFF